MVETGEQGRSRIFGRGSTTLSEAADSAIKLRLGSEAYPSNGVWGPSSRVKLSGFYVNFSPR